METKKLLFDRLVADVDTRGHTKVTVVGVGQVGMACAYHLVATGAVNEIALCDVLADKLEGEEIDLQQATAFTRHCHVKASTDYSITAGSKVCVVTAGARQNPGESRLNLLQRNVAIFKNIIPKLVQHSPNCIIVVVSNPVDLLAYLAWKISGFPPNRVFGSGTLLDSARFRVLLSEKLGVSASSCHGYILGEHGDSSVPVWSSTAVGGVKLLELNPKMGQEDDPENWKDVHKEVVQSAYKVIEKKGYTSWAIGAAVSTLCRCLIRNERSIYPLSTLLPKDYLPGFDSDVFLSLPCACGQDGITDIVRMRLNENEINSMKKSATVLNELIKQIAL